LASLSVCVGVALSALLVNAGQVSGAEPSAAPSEIRRTKPDFVLYDPTGGKPPAWNDPDFFWLNEHVLVQPNGRGELLAMWTSERLKPWKWSIKYAHSKDGGEALKNPVSPCPISALERGDYVLLFNNNDGTSEGRKGPEDRAARRPAYLARGECGRSRKMA